MHGCNVDQTPYRDPNLTEQNSSRLNPPLSYCYCVLLCFNFQIEYGNILTGLSLVVVGL